MFSTNLLSRLIVERAGDVDGAGLILHGKGAAVIATGDFIANSRR